MPSRATYTAIGAGGKHYVRHLRTANWQVVVTHWTGMGSKKPVWCASQQDVNSVINKRTTNPKWPVTSTETLTATASPSAMAAADLKGPNKQQQKNGKKSR